MFISIRLRLFIYMTVSIVFFALLLCAFNSFFIENYYINNKKSSLLKVTQELSELIQEKKPEDFYNQDLIYAIDKLEKSTGTAISIGEPDGTLYYPIPPDFQESSQRTVHNPFFVPDQNNDMSFKQPPPNPRPLSSEIEILGKQTDDSLFMILKDPRLMIETLRYQTKLDNDLILLVWIPMAEITESASVSNRFTFIVAILTMLITGIWALFISGRFTRPIKQMNRITKEISDLNFSQTLDIKGDDEIGQLSQSINHLSNRLAGAISELNNKNKQLEEDIDRERKLDKMRQEFISSVSHELKTPLFLIQGYAEGLKNNIVQDENKRSFYCDVIMDEASKMDILVEDLLDLSQMESGIFAIKRSDFDIVLLLKEITRKLEPSFVENNIYLKIEMPDQLSVNADPVRTEQVIVNFLNNALNHVKGKNIIKITIKTDKKKGRIIVFNSGSPIPKESLDKIWTSFYKVDQARTRENSGMGLGLSIVKAIQQAHHNEYGVNNVNGGVEFWFNVDLSQ